MILTDNGKVLKSPNGKVYTGNSSGTTEKKEPPVEKFIELTDFQYDSSENMHYFDDNQESDVIILDCNNVEIDYNREFRNLKPNALVVLNHISWAQMGQSFQYFGFLLNVDSMEFGPSDCALQNYHVGNDGGEYFDCSVASLYLDDFTPTRENVNSIYVKHNVIGNGISEWVSDWCGGYMML